MLHYLKEYASPAPLPEAGTTVIQNVSRRSLLKGAAGLVVALQVLPLGQAKAFEPYPHGGQSMSERSGKRSAASSSRSTATARSTIVAHRSEMGTGSRTSLPMIIADEMEADWSRVKIVQAPGDEKKYGNQDTDGSRSLRHHIQPAREIGASVRWMLEEAAAKQWDVAHDDVEAIGHQVVHKSLGSRLGFGELAKAAMGLPAPSREQLNFKDERAFRYIGKGSVQITDLHDITTGKAVYGADVSLPGMKIAVIARPPVVGGKVKSVDSAAEAVPGVEAIEQIPGSIPPAKFAPLGGVAVIARNTWAALKGRDALKIEWDDGPHAGFNTADYRKELQRLRAMRRARSSATKAMPKAPCRRRPGLRASTTSRTWRMRRWSRRWPSPRSPTARPRSGRRPKPLRRAPGYRRSTRHEGRGRDGPRHPAGRRLRPQVEVRLRDRGGAAVQEDRRAGAGAVDPRGRYPPQLLPHDLGGADRDRPRRQTTSPVAWRHRSAAPSFLSTFAPDSGEMHPVEVGMGLADMPFEISNIRCEDCKALAHTRVGWYRSVSNIPRAFAVQSIAAELAHELGKDQKDFLLELIGAPRVIDLKAAGMPEDFWNYGEPYEEFPNDTGRLRRVVELAAEKAGWGKITACR